jgi:hypothetical protein|tara:strand:+ start:290 stop:577 length:288 start_codon:yes stop_codon:yes gene_type:complete
MKYRIYDTDPNTGWGDRGTALIVDIDRDRYPHLSFNGIKSLLYEAAAKANLPGTINAQNFWIDHGYDDISEGTYEKMVDEAREKLNMLLDVKLMK